MYFLLLYQYTSHWLHYDAAFLYNCWFLFIIIMELRGKYALFWQEYSVKYLILRCLLRLVGLLIDLHGGAYMLEIVIFKEIYTYYQWLYGYLISVFWQQHLLEYRKLSFSPFALSREWNIVVIQLNHMKGEWKNMNLCAFFHCKYFKLSWDYIY